MAANVTLTVNVEQAKAALNQVNTAITQIRLNGNQITIGGQKVAQQMAQVANATDRVAKSTEKSSRTSQQSINQITKGFASITGASSKALTSVRAFGKGMVSVWTAIVVAVELAAVTFRYFFNNLTESIPKLLTKSQNLVQAVETQTQKFEKQRKETDELRKALEGLAEKESLTNTQQLYAQAIIDRLNQKYKDLKITIDQTTGSIKNLANEEYKMNEQDRQRELKLSRKQVQAQKQAVNAQLANTFGTSNVSLDNDVSGRDFFTFAENTFGDLSSVDRDRIAKKFSNGDLETKRQVLVDLATDYSNNQEIQSKLSGAIAAMDKLIEAQNKFNDLNSAASRIIENENSKLDKNKKALEQISSLQEKSKETMQRLAEAQKEEEFRALETNQQRADYVRNELEQLTKDAETLQTQIKNANDEFGHNAYLEDISTTQTSTFKKQIEDNDEAVTKLRQNISKLERDYKKVAGSELGNGDLSVENRTRIQNRISSLTDRIGKMNPQYSQGKEEKQRLQNQRANLTKQLEIINKILGISKEIAGYDNKRTELVEQLNSNLQIGNKAEQDRLSAQKKLEELRTSEAQKQLQIQQKKVQLTELEKALKEQQAKQQKSIQQIYSNYEAQLDAYNKSTEELAIETALANAEKAKGAELTQDQIDQIKFYVSQLEKIRKLEEERKEKQRQADDVEGVFKGYEEDQSVAYLKIINKQKEAVLLEAKLNAEKAKGAALTEEEYQSLKNYVDVQQLIDEANSQSFAINRQGQKIITNQLAQKGGFASSVVVDRARDVSKQILAVQQRQYDLQNQIKNAMDKYSVIQ